MCYVILPLNCKWAVKWMYRVVLLNRTVCGHVWSCLFTLLIAAEGMPLLYIGDHPCKYKRTGDSLYSSAAQWHQALKWFQWICPPPRWAIQIRPATSLTFIHIPLEIHPSVFFHSPPSCSLSPHEFLHPDTPRWGLHLLSTPLVFSSAVFLWFYSPSPLFRHTSGGTGLSDTSPGKKKPKRLSISFLPGHENYGFPNE